MTAGSNSTGIAARLRNLLIVLVAIGLSVAVFFGLNSKTNASSLTAMAESAMPLETALANGKPTLMEFYANWCTSCQAMAPDLYALKQEYDDRVNFVMLNVDNSKWLPEMLHYRVDGIPHFVFLNGKGESIASSVGEQPRSIVAENLDALIADVPLPHLQTNGQTSQVEVPIETSGSADPRSHGAQVVTPQSK
ncbi:thioredoxin family protein [Microcoleus sp. FACHB-1515]|uniref:thioredoxin family protein n=1 Tax=Cyanophyceae TaxID=3028117 RepID=UPI001684709A|nr:thioredoxin family protein [Microcoleus sp. FACHB-1515]MBD2090707.1 thioredoxin family protein [Microcoleus sp. FACHB-1515]